MQILRCENRAGELSLVHRAGHCVEPRDQTGAIERASGDKAEGMVKFFDRAWRKPSLSFDQVRGDEIGVQVTKLTAFKSPFQKLQEKRT